MCRQPMSGKYTGNILKVRTRTISELLLNWQLVLLYPSRTESLHRYASVDRAASGLSLDCKGSVYQQSFLHANESQALAHLCLFAIKTHSLNPSM